MTAEQLDTLSKARLTVASEGCTADGCREVTAEIIDADGTSFTTAVHGYACKCGTPRLGAPRAKHRVVVAQQLQLERPRVASEVVDDVLQHLDELGARFGHHGPDENRWVAVSAPSTTLDADDACVLADGRVLVVSGDLSYRYEGDDRWSALGAVSQKARSESALAALRDDGALLIGGGEQFEVTAPELEVRLRNGATSSGGSTKHTGGAHHVSHHHHHHHF